MFGFWTMAAQILATLLKVATCWKTGTFGGKRDWICFEGKASAVKPRHCEGRLVESDLLTYLLLSLKCPPTTALLKINGYKCVTTNKPPIVELTVEQQLPHNICNLYNQHHALTLGIPQFFINVYKCWVTFTHLSLDLRRDKKSFGIYFCPVYSHMMLYTVILLIKVTFQKLQQRKIATCRCFHWKVWSTVALMLIKKYLSTQIMFAFCFVLFVILLLRVSKKLHEPDVFGVFFDGDRCLCLWFFLSTPVGNLPYDGHIYNNTLFSLYNTHPLQFTGRKCIWRFLARTR